MTALPSVVVVNAMRASFSVSMFIAPRCDVDVGVITNHFVGIEKLYAEKSSKINFGERSRKSVWPLITHTLNAITYSHISQGPRMRVNGKAVHPMRARRFVATLNNYTPAQEKELQTSEYVSFIFYGREIAPTTGTPHLQLYFETPVRRTKNAIRKAVPALARAWIDIAKGTVDQNRIYNGKTDLKPFERGKAMCQGKRADIVAIREAVDEGYSDALLWQNHFALMLRYHKSVKVYKSTRSARRKWVTNILLFVGPPGTGKSQLAHAMGNSGVFGDFYVVPGTKGSGLYMDGYDGQECVLIDEMDGNRMAPTSLNGLCDRYEHTVHVHGSADVQFLARTIIICSNYHPRQWWKPSVNIGAFMRRVTLTHFRGNDWHTGLPVVQQRVRPTMLVASVPAYITRTHLLRAGDKGKDEMNNDYNMI